MKKYLLLLSLAFIAVTAFGQNSIPNGNFETWDSATYYFPQNYLYSSNEQNFYNFLPFNVTRTTDAYHGTYAAQLTSIITNMDSMSGYFLNINPNGSGNWTGGMPYSQQAVGIRGWYKYNIASADSATILVGFSKAHVNIGQYMLHIGGIHRTYTLFHFTFNPALTATPDSVIFAVLSGRISSNGPWAYANDTLKIDSVSFTGVSSQPADMNGDFELWQQSPYYYAPVTWFGGNSSAVFRTTDAEQGHYALEVKATLGIYNNHPAAQMPEISNGYTLPGCGNNCNEYGGFPYTNTKDTLAFWYKYSPTNALDSEAVNCFFINNDSITNGVFAWLYATPGSAYKYMEYPFNLSRTPDTAIIQIMPYWYDTLVSVVGTDFKIDSIYFKSNVSVGIFNYKNDNTISIFPNPVTDIITIANTEAVKQNYIVSIKNIEGQEVWRKEINFATTYSISVGDLSDGVYILSLQNDKKNYVRKIIIQR